MTGKLRIVVGCDEAGFEYKETLKKDLAAHGLVADVIDVGVGADGHTAYPHIAVEAARMVADGAADRALLVCGTGLGVAIAANKVKGVRAALAWNHSTATLAREHNDANVVAVGGRQHTVEEATELIEAFLTEPFSNDERHVRRIGKIAAYESTGEVIE